MKQVFNDLLEKQKKYRNREVPLMEVLLDANLKEKPHLVDNKYCSECHREAEIYFDEDWDIDPEEKTCNFVVFPYYYCDKCKIRLS
jgi:hypothetical protein